MMAKPLTRSFGPTIDRRKEVVQLNLYIRFPHLAHFTS